MSFYAKVMRRGRTSVTVQVEATTEARGSVGVATKVTEATLVYVAVDEQGAPRPIAA